LLNQALVMLNLAQQLAALRKKETKTCACGVEFTGLIKKTKCNKCLNRDRQARFKAQKAVGNKQTNKEESEQ